MMPKTVWVLILSVIVIAKGSTVPFIEPCLTTDSGCITSSAQTAISTIADGIPELGLPTLDPMHLDHISSDDGGLQLVFTNTTVVGLRNCGVLNARIDAKNRQHVTLRCSVNLKGNYKLSGRLLIFPISGEGLYEINIRDIVIKTHSDLAIITGDDDVPHWHITKWKHWFDVTGNAHFFFDNLFNGNKVLGDPILKFANDNWVDVMHEIAPTIVKAIVTRVVDSVEQLYKAVPLEELSKN